MLVVSCAIAAAVATIAVFLEKKTATILLALCWLFLVAVIWRMIELKIIGL